MTDADPRTTDDGHRTTDDDHRTTAARPRIIAHRGFAGAAPENTLGAIEAIADGTHPASMVELDVMPCADGTPVVFHDAHLGGGDGESRGLTDATGVVWETPCEEVLGARILGTDETVPTLEAALAALPSAVGLNLELKNAGTFDLRPGEALDGDEVTARRELWDPFVRRVLAVLDGTTRDVLVSSFHEAAVASVHDQAHELPVAPLLSTSVEDGLSVAGRYDCEAVHPPLTMLLDSPLGEGSDAPPDASAGATDLLAAADDGGYDVNVWTVRTWFEAERLAALGVDGLIADYPDLLAVSRGDDD